MDQSAWPKVASAVAAAPYPVDVLPADAQKASACLATLGITTKSWLGAVVANAGGLLIDHGWLRVLGCGHDRLPDVAAEAQAGLLVVAYDVMGGRFAWLPNQPGDDPTVHYFGPDELGWEDLELGYGEWLSAVLAGSLTGFYDTLRWPGWATDVAGLAYDQGISAWPPPFTAEGREPSAVSRRAVPLAELVSFYRDAARQLG